VNRVIFSNREGEGDICEQEWHLLKRVTVGSVTCASKYGTAQGLDRLIPDYWILGNTDSWCKYELHPASTIPEQASGLEIMLSRMAK